MCGPISDERTENNQARESIRLGTSSAPRRKVTKAGKRTTASRRKSTRAKRELAVA